MWTFFHHVCVYVRAFFSRICIGLWTQDILWLKLEGMCSHFIMVTEKAHYRRFIWVVVTESTGCIYNTLTKYSTYLIIVSLP